MLCSLGLLVQGKLVFIGGAFLFYFILFYFLRRIIGDLGTLYDILIGVGRESQEFNTSKPI